MVGFMLHDNSRKSADLLLSFFKGFTIYIADKHFCGPVDLSSVAGY